MSKLADVPNNRCIKRRRSTTNPQMRILRKNYLSNRYKMRNVCKRYTAIEHNIMK